MRRSLRLHRLHLLQPNKISVSSLTRLAMTVVDGTGLVGLAVGIAFRDIFWINGHEYSPLKVRSSLIRLVKCAYQKEGISMPDEAREVVFPQGIPVTMLDQKATEKPAVSSAAERPAPSDNRESEAVSTQAEGGLYSEASSLKEQAREAKPLQEGENLLDASDPAPAS